MCAHILYQPEQEVHFLKQLRQAATVLGHVIAKPRGSRYVTINGLGPKIRNVDGLEALFPQ